ncbi:MAG: YbaK/EbsC family protein [Patescibacteria group bacterium]
MEKYHKVVSKILDVLRINKCWFETFEHEPVRTSEEAAKIRTGYTLHQGAKAMIVRIKKSESDKKFVMLVLPADLRFDDGRVKRLFSAKDVRFATEQEVLDLTNGIQLGGVPPFGNLFELEVIADPRLFENEKIIFNAGDRSFSVAMKSKDYKDIVNPTVEKIVED